ncbi:unnamed protein product [Effrenium voratum]|uniref:leucine--tRNA ligase n=1 Tax=Effrenium voratum TaxID=2562239 RepID=A0AA36I7M2_9DINO|nr:unnamed protein product [Effrenium voratum]
MSILRLCRRLSSSAAASATRSRKPMAEAKQSTARRDLLQQIEVDVQKKWEEAKVWEIDAPDGKEEKFMCTFPYPYMNGLLHIGHAFTMTKAIFAAQFHRLLGKKALFPFGFHCTGMPIQAAANKLSRELETFGTPFPTFPPGRPTPKESSEGVIDIDDEGVTMTWKAPPSTGKKAIKEYVAYMQVKEGDFKKVKTVPHPADAAALKAQGNKIKAVLPVESGGCRYKVEAVLEDGTKCPASPISDEVSVDAAPKDKKSGAAGGKRVAKKILAKSGDAASQYEILKAMGLSAEEIPKFVDPLFWLNYFPPLGVRDCKRFGMPVDFRRSFITTSQNDFYDSFVRWQFRKLKKSEKIGFGKRPTIYSEIDGQACMDHDRAEGEGVGPQEYTAIKIELLEPTPDMQKKLPKGSKVFLLAATLRAETMPGQTNCWILPAGQYGCFEAPNKEIFVTSHRAARNMSFQDILMPWGKPKCIMEVSGQELMGKKVKAPTAKYEYVHVLPLPTIKMDKGTGIVTSVPSDSPDDYAAYIDLMKSDKKREHYGVKKEWVEGFDLIPIIDVEIDGEMRAMAAQYMCEKLGVQSINDRVKLAEAHDTCYKLGFDKGTMSIGPFKGQPVKKAKFEFRTVMIQAKQAFIYSEPEKKVVSRSGDECVVAAIDQWYLKYGAESWRGQIEGHLNSPNFISYNDRIKESFEDAIGWLKEWACSRSFGLGTQVPWDEQFVIESLSDSTIYMAYYTVAHLLHGEGNLDGKKGSPAGIKAADLTDEVWDFVFLNGPDPKNCKIPKKTLDQMRKEFRFWYPMDLRVSGKDLIQNHLTMALYNHACVWEKEPDMWPRSFFCNGWLLVNNEKMSKSKGNFFTVEDIIKNYSADTVRLAMANSGDTLEPANFDQSVCNKAVLTLAVFLDTMKSMIGGSEKLDTGSETARFVDVWFANEMNRLVQESKKFYETMYYREALRTCYFEFTSTFDQYRDICKAASVAPNKTLVTRYFEWQMIILSPICPHFCEHGWSMLGKKGTVLDARYPSASKPVEASLTKQGDYIFNKVPHDFIKLQEKASKSGTAKSAVVYVAKEFPEWKKTVLAKLMSCHSEGKLPLIAQEEMKANPQASAQWKEIMTLLMQDASLKPFGKHLGPFAAFKRDEAAAFGVSALDASLPFDELALIKENVAYLQQKLQVSVEVRAADSPASPEHQDAATNAQPGKPGIHFLVEGGKAGGGKAKAAQPAAKSGGAPKAMTDMTELNKHLESRTRPCHSPSSFARARAKHGFFGFSGSLRAEFSVREAVSLPRAASNNPLPSEGGANSGPWLSVKHGWPGGHVNANRAGGGLGGLGVAVMGAPRAPCALRLVVVLSLAYSGHAQTIRARKQKEKLPEGRLIVRYPEGSGPKLAEYIRRLEQIEGVKRAEPLRSLDMAVVQCRPGAEEDQVLAALDAEKSVELAVPDSWVQAFVPESAPSPESALCSSHPECKAFSLQGECCPAPDGARMACCASKPPQRKPRRPQSQSTISLQSVHGGYITVSKIGFVGWRGKKADPDAQFRLEAHPDGYVSLKSIHGTYLVTSPSGQLVAWHRGHGEADDWEKFKLIYNTDAPWGAFGSACAQKIGRWNETWNEPRLWSPREPPVGLFIISIPFLIPCIFRTSKSSCSVFHWKGASGGVQSCSGEGKIAGEWVGGCHAWCSREDTYIHMYFIYVYVYIYIHICIYSSGPSTSRW